MLTSCQENSIYPRVPYSTTLAPVEALTTDLRLSENDPNFEKIETIPAGAICVDPQSHKDLVEAALTCEKDLKKLRKICKPQ